MMHAKLKKSLQVLLLTAIACAGFAYWYAGSLSITAVSLKALQHDPQKPLTSQLVIEVSSRASQIPLVPDSVRQFFRMQTELCLLNPDQSALVNDDTLLSCVPDRDEAQSRQRSHAVEVSQFEIPFSIKANNFNGKQLFLKSLRQHKGVWLKLRLVSYFGPPPVESKPVFLDFTFWCMQHGDVCMQVLE